MNVDDLCIGYVYSCMIDEKTGQTKLGIFKYPANKKGEHRSPIFGELYQQKTPLRCDFVFCVKISMVLEKIRKATDTDRWK